MNCLQQCDVAASNTLSSCTLAYCERDRTFRQKCQMADPRKGTLDMSSAGGPSCVLTVCSYEFLKTCSIIFIDDFLFFYFFIYFLFCFILIMPQAFFDNRHELPLAKFSIHLPLIRDKKKKNNGGYEGQGPSMVCNNTDFWELIVIL